MSWRGKKQSPFFAPYGNLQSANGLGQDFRGGEQGLLAGLVAEAISIFGIDFVYIPRVLNNFDSIYGQDDSSSYESPYQVVAYVKNASFSGEGHFMSKFGLQIRDEMTFTFSTQGWLEAVGVPAGLDRPRESDLLFYPLNSKLFQIKFVNNLPIHYQLGILPSWDVTCELIEYSNEKLNTGIPEIDRLWRERTSDVYDFALMDENGNVLLNENGQVLVSDDYSSDAISRIGNNEEYDDRSDEIVDWNELDPFNETGSTVCPSQE